MDDVRGGEVGKREVDTGRRDLMRVAATAGLVGAAGLAAAAAPAPRAGAAAAGAAAGAGEDPKAPEGLGKNAVPDQRFAFTYQTPVSQGTRILMDHLAALGRRDINAVADTLHFPFASFEGTDVYTANTREEFVSKPPPSLNMTLQPKRHSANDGYLKPGSYEVFQGLEVLGTLPVNATISLVYDRYDNRGKKLLRSEGMYAVTNNDGRWAIELASTIFTPADMIGTVFDETVRQAKLLRINHTLSAATGDETFDRMTVVPGKTAGLSGGASWTAQVKGQEEVMKGYRVKGVKSRLQVRETTGNEPLRGERGTYQEYWDGMGTLGLGPWGFIYGTWKEGRVLHHTADKAHVQASAVRYTAAGEEMSLAVQTMVVVYKGGKWSSPGNLIYATVHDRNNDIHPGGLEPV